jgi:hypothetical protein
MRPTSRSHRSAIASPLSVRPRRCQPRSTSVTASLQWTISSNFGNGYTLTVRYRDNGVNARVLVRLKEYNRNTGVTNTLLTFDNNGFAQGGNFQLQTVSFCAPPLDFFNNAYFIEAQLDKTAAAGDPQLGLVQLGRTNC